ncbi:Glucosidase 2 subunit alpha [Vanrija pseudolonga]|uniref:Glucosidase II subunit alpha n=1 Tax=Vanrija pseudolonga TaxID=143232 RepID=A0AAF0YFQ0_9TREE|nr:Glucosidase 2 subunit alpha [Vanrija pseudolonga]
MRFATTLALLALIAAPATTAVKKEDFKECAQTSFCRRLRSIAGRQEAAEADKPGSFASPYTVGSAVHTPGIDTGASSWTFPLKSSLYPAISFSLRVDALAGGSVRVRVDEVGSSTKWKRYNETARWALLDAEPALSSTASISTANGVSTLAYGDGLTLEITHSPLKIVQKRNGAPQVVFNERSLFHVEHFRTKPEPMPEAVEGEGAEGDAGAEQVVLAAPETPDRSWFEADDNDLFEERWKQWTDSKPKGPEGFSLDFSFPGSDHVFGLPEHASPLSLPSTVGEGSYYTEPYRLWNVDIFEYLADSPMALYGAVPLLHAHNKQSSVGVLNLVGSETWVDVAHTDAGVKTHWVSESGIVDFLLLPGPRPTDLFKQYADLTGPAQMPPQFATAYHQCRWNYNTQAEVIEVQDKFDEADIPLDVTWLDIEYAEEHRYFDWDKKNFPDPVKMQDEVASKGRKMVAIVDPHVKKQDSFRIYTDSRDQDILIKKADGSNFDGWCWTGSSVWVDFFNPKSWEWWTKMFTFGVWKDSTKALFIWNDMNEPSVFDGPEITMPKDNIHVGGWEHRDVHNINGMMFHNQTQHAITVREADAKRPFVLSRSYFAGSHRYGAIWIGDNLGTWDHLAGETAVFLSNSIAGMSFVGSDVGGFFGNPSHEILVRWYQAGAFMPFFRAHAHIDTKRREPYLFDEPIRGYIRDAIRLRYQLLPTWYNAFHDAATHGYPVIWPQYAYFPEDEGGFAVDDQYYVGDSGLLFKPVVTEGATTTDVYLADNQPYYDYFSDRVYPASAKPRNVTIDTPLEAFPLLIQGGHIVPSRQRVRRASTLMWQDPFTLVVALDRDGGASGQLYLDDGEGYAFEKGEYVHRTLSFKSERYSGTLTSTKAGDNAADNAWAKKIAHVGVERVVVLGFRGLPSSVTVAGKDAEFEFKVAKRGVESSVLVIKNPGVKVTDDWVIEIA